MSKQTIYSILIIVVFIILAVFISKYYKDNMINTQPNQNITAPIDTSASITTNVNYVNTDFESNGDIQSDIKSIDADISQL